MKKIAQFIPSMYPSGGAERVTHQLANDLSETHDVTVITLGENTFKDCSYTRVSLGFSDTFFSKLWSMVYGPIALRSYCKKNNIDLVVSHMERANFISLLSKIPTISVVHNYKYLTKPFNRFLISNLYPRAQKVITVSQGIENKLKEIFFLTNTQTIYNYFDLEEIKNKLEEPLLNKDVSFFENKTHTFINIGRLTEQKGQDVLIDAFVQANIPNSQLLIIGEGPNKKKLEEHIRASNKENIHLLGTRKNVFPLLKHADTFVLSSRWEGFGLVLVEALAAGLPVISTDCMSGPREILIKNSTPFGNLVTTNDTNGLQTELKKIITKDISRSKQQVRAKDFSKDKVIPVWRNLLESQHPL